MTDTLEALVESIRDPDRGAEDAARNRQDTLTKPRGSLGALEGLSARIAGMTGSPRPRLAPGAIFVMAADHGVCDEGVSAYPREVTAQMVLNFLRGGAAINVLARTAGARVVVTDVGVAEDLPDLPGLRARKVARGTGNIARTAAMSPDQARLCVETGAALFMEEFAREPFGIAATGDMGIGNTTSATAIASVLAGVPPGAIVGRGTGVDDAGLSRKLHAIEAALALHRPDPARPLETLAAVGGFEIGALAGVILAAAARRVPVVLDGFISGAAALLARAFCPRSVGYMIAGHLSADSGHAAMLASLGLEPLLSLGMRLGEGSGAALALPLCVAACRVLDEMATFGEAGVSGRE